MASQKQYVCIRLPQGAWHTLWESLEIDARSTAVAPELRRELREALDQVEYVAEPHAAIRNGSRKAGDT